MARTTSRFAVVLALTVAVGGCATTGTYRSAQRAEQAEDYDRAVADYTAASKKHPNDRTTQLALQRAKLRASQEHLTRARRLEATGKLDEALVEYELAAELNAGNGDIDAALRNLRMQLRNRVAVSREGKTQLEALIDQSQKLAPAGFELPPEVRLPASLVFRDASVRDIYTV